METANYLGSLYANALVLLLSESLLFSISADSRAELKQKAVICLEQ